jgi:hypothetical protein
MGELFAALLGRPCCLLDSGVDKQARGDLLYVRAAWSVVSKNNTLSIQAIWKWVLCSVSSRS